MCGLAGWFSRENPDLLIVQSAAARLQHRGPDDDGFEAGRGWALGFRRLSILDLSPLGHQPMWSADARFVLIFNGEIYNFLELRAELEQQGARFRSGGDTEVVLALLSRAGAAGLSKLNGMFALALIDTQARTFLLARDRLGVKPLYYLQRDGELRFASELKALLAWPDARPSIDSAAAQDYFTLGYVPGASTIFSGYRKLEPANFLAGSIDAPDQATPARWWHLTLNDDRATRALTGEEDAELRALLDDAVRIRLRSDVKLGLFLSGGMDSGLVAAAAAKATNSEIVAFTVGFDAAAADETALARLTADRTGLRHLTTTQTAGDLAEIDKLAWFYDEPFGDPSALPFFALCQAAKPHATVFLSGDGGDEAFAGYRRYVETARWQKVLSAATRLQSGIRLLAYALPELSAGRYKLEKLTTADDGYAAMFDQLANDPALRVALNRDLGRSGAGGYVLHQWSRSRSMRSITARQQALDYAMYLPDDVLTKVDRASMANSIEVRSPFLDYRLVEFAAQLPRGALLDRRGGKRPLRRLAKEALPPAVAQGAKRGFAVPLDDWFRTRAGIGMIEDRLLSSSGAALGFWDAGRLRKLLRQHVAGHARAFGELFWRLLVFEAWSQQHLAPGAHSSANRPAAGPLPTAARRPRQVQPELLVAMLASAVSALS